MNISPLISICHAYDKAGLCSQGNPVTRYHYPALNCVFVCDQCHLICLLICTIVVLRHAVPLISLRSRCLTQACHQLPVYHSRMELLLGLHAYRASSTVLNGRSKGDKFQRRETDRERHGDREWGGRRGVKEKSWCCVNITVTDHNRLF